MSIGCLRTDSFLVRKAAQGVAFSWNYLDRKLYSCGRSLVLENVTDLPIAISREGVTRRPIRRPI